jgi:hypothetical protein
MNWPLTEIETKAIAAQSSPSFPINVEEIRRTVADLLSVFGRNGIFDEYTVHDFNHVYAPDWEEFSESAQNSRLRLFAPSVWSKRFDGSEEEDELVF